VGILAALAFPKPSLHDFRWREATAEEIRRAEASAAAEEVRSKSKQSPPFDVMMWIIRESGRTLKDGQQFLPFVFGLRFFLAPFFAALSLVWLLYLFARYVLIGYVARGFKKDA
jgi:hypothetical protein